MDRDGGWGALIWLAVLGYGGYWYYTQNEASAGMSGRAFYEACWEYRSKTVGFKEPQPSNPYQAAQWKSCEVVVRRSIFSEGLVFAGAESGNDAERLRGVCPNSWSEIPMAGAFFLYVQDTEKVGGVSGVGSFLPAKWSVESWAKNRWPSCNAEREQQGYPKIVEKSPGNFSWETPCAKCK